MTSSEFWEKKIKWQLELSKAFRSIVVIGLIALLIQLESRMLFIVFLISVVALSVRRGPESPWTALKFLAFGITGISLVLGILLYFVKDDIARRINYPVPILLATLVSAALYVGLRIRHLVGLYKTAKDYSENGRIRFEVRSRMYCVGAKPIQSRNVLLRSDDSVTTAQFRKADLLIRSISLLHINLRTAHTTNITADHLKDVPTAELRLCQLSEDIRLPAEDIPDSATFNPQRDLPLDLVILLKQGDIEIESLKELTARVNGVI
jgi:hypothetical protein